MAEKKTIQQRFEIFHNANPHVYRLLCAGALKMQKQGRAHYGAKALVEVLRYSRVETVAGEPPRDHFKLPNDLTSRYARKIMDEVPELEGFFHTATLITA